MNLLFIDSKPDAISLMQKLIDELPGNNSLVALRIDHQSEAHPWDNNDRFEELGMHGFDLVIFSLHELHLEYKLLRQIEFFLPAAPCLALGYSRDYMLVRSIMQTGICDYLHWDDFVKMGFSEWLNEIPAPNQLFTAAISEIQKNSEAQTPEQNRDLPAGLQGAEYAQVAEKRTNSAQPDIIFDSDIEFPANHKIKSHDHFDHKSIAKALDYIHQNFSDHNLSLNKVSDFVSLSEKHFSRLFSKSCSITFSDYLTNYRMDMAKHLLANSEQKIYQVALLVGYSSVEHFSRYFKKHSGYSPDHFRKAMDQNRSKSGLSAL